VVLALGLATFLVGIDQWRRPAYLLVPEVVLIANYAAVTFADAKLNWISALALTAGAAAGPGLLLQRHYQGSVEVKPNTLEPTA
jgi:hypothetical protein